MPGKIIRIDELAFPLSSGSPFEFPGIHSGRDLSGFNLDLTVYSDTEARQMEKLIKKKDTVKVEDPFADRHYEAALGQTSYSYQDGRQGRLYHFEVMELDEAVGFKVLEIEGHPFPVIRNIETLDDGVVGLHILLHLSADEFEGFQGLLKPGPIQIRRIGIDDNPIVQRFGGARYWSSHQEGSEKFYKQVVRFYPTDFPTGKIGIASGHEQIAHSQMILALTARYEALVRMLVDNGQISRENGEALLSEEWQTLIDAKRKIMMRSKLEEVGDAELELD